VLTGRGVLSPGVKRPEREVKSEWSYTPTPSLVYLLARRETILPFCACTAVRLIDDRTQSPSALTQVHCGLMLCGWCLCSAGLGSAAGIPPLPVRNAYHSCVDARAGADLAESCIHCLPINRRAHSSQQTMFGRQRHKTQPFFRSC